MYGFSAVSSILKISDLEDDARLIRRCVQRLRGVLIEGGAAQPRAARTVGSLSGLHPDSQRPPSLPPPWIGGLGSVGPLGKMVANRRPTQEKLDRPNTEEGKYTPALK